jgi:UDP-GlcNAc:undecaprenyl-phosphate GlcNAc-1-phosphate transferase
LPTLQAVLPPFLLAFVVSVLLVPACRVLARRSGLVAHPRDDRWHRTTVPLLGGAAIALSLLITALVVGVAREVVVPLSTAMAIFIVGLMDDVLALKPATKLIAQIALAAALVFWGYQLNWVESRLLDSVLTILWVVGLTNAFNLMDNMDGLCAGTAVIVGVMLVSGLLLGVTRHLAGDEIAFLAALIGATAGFLVYNFPPASIFMGDSGSLLLGFTLASLTLSPEGVRGSRSDLLSVISGPVFVLLIPIFDTALVTVMRLLSGRSPAQGGRDHSSHRLVAIGLSERTAVFVLWSLAALGGVIGTMLRQTADGWSVLVAGLFLCAMGIFAVYLSRVRVYEVDASPPNITPLVADFMYKRRAAEVLLDFGLITIAYYGAYRLRFEGGEYLRNVENFYASLPVVLAAQLIAFFIVGVYRGVWRHFGLMDGVTVVKGVVLGTAAAQLVILYAYHYFSYSRSVFIIYAALLIGLVIASRASFRLIGEFVQRRREAGMRAVIFGAGESANVAVRELQARLDVKVLGFIDDDPQIARMRVHGYPVLGAGPQLQRMIEGGEVDVVVINRQGLEQERVADMEALCTKAGVTLVRLNIDFEELVVADRPLPSARQRRHLRVIRK